MKGLYFNEFGENDVLRYGDLPCPQLKADQVMVKTAYIGLNFADIYRRRGEYHIEKNTPYINGYEGVGEVVELGEAASKNLLGKQVLFVDAPFANAEYVAVDHERIIQIPAKLSLETAAAIGLQGLTADFLAHDLGKNQKGAQVFITGISGGVGQLLSQMLVADGIEVFGSASTEEKRAIALDHGVKKVYPSREVGWQEHVGGKFDTVYDGVGKTLNSSLEMLKHRGKVVFFGMAGGNPPQIDLIKMLAQSKSILTGDLWDYLTSAKERQRRSDRLFKYVLADKIKLEEPTIFSLADGKNAYEFLESGKSAGKILLKP